MAQWQILLGRYHALLCAVLCCTLSLFSYLESAEEFSAHPGRAKPHKTVAPQAFFLAWGEGAEERSYVVIEPGDALRRPAIVATVDVKTGALRVVYAGTAFIDDQDKIHIDCRKSILHGPDSQRWSPDSFSIDKKGGVRWMDDARRNGSGHVLVWAVGNSEQLKDAPLADKVDEQVSYGALRLSVRVFLEGVL